MFVGINCNYIHMVLRERYNIWRLERKDTNDLLQQNISQIKDQPICPDNYEIKKKHLMAITYINVSALLISLK